MMTKGLRIGVAVACMGAVVWLNMTILLEAFGSGPPYYGRTTNMDKWQNPIPWLAVIDFFVLLIMILVLLPVLQKMIQHGTKTARMMSRH